MAAILLDTHAAIWSAEGTIRSAAARVIDAAAQRAELLLSPISAWEIGMLANRGRLRLRQGASEFIREIFAHPGTVTATITAEIALEAAGLRPALTGDPVDRILIATAIAYGAQLMTRDRAIQEYAKASRSLRCLAC
jgi:PIN domain nuclease of toxin-antitoxin system